MYNQDKKLFQIICKDCIDTFEIVVEGISKVHTCRSLGQIRIIMNNDKDFDAQIRPTADENLFFVDINEGVISRIYDLVNSNKEHISPAILDKNNCDPFQSITESPYLLDTVYDLSLQFIFHHEISHYLCGHLEYNEHTNSLLPRARSLKESTIGFYYNKKDVSDESIIRSHYLELEADATSIEWLLDRVVLGCVNREISISLGINEDDDYLKNKSISELPSGSRLLAFRYLLLSVWIVIILIEANRNKKYSEDKKFHPLPSARLHGVLSTMLLWYSNIDEININQSGEMIVSPGEKHRNNMVEFLQLIVKPVARNVINFSDEYSIKGLVSPIEVERSVDGLVEFMREFSRICQRQQPVTNGGKQLERIENIRSEITGILKSVRFFEEML